MEIEIGMGDFDNIQQTHGSKEEQKVSSLDKQLSVISNPEPKKILSEEEIKMNEFLVDRDSIYNKWKDSPYLEGFPDNQVKQVALILDNQDRFLKQYGKNSSNDFKTIITLELAQKVLQDFIVFDLVPIQPMRHPRDYIYYRQFQYEKSEEINDIPVASLLIKTDEISAVTRQLITIPEEIDINEFASRIKEKLTNEVITDLSNNVGTITNKKLLGTKDEIYNNLCEISDIIHRKTLRSGMKWIIVSTEMAKRLSKYICNKSDINLDEIKIIQKIGIMCSAWKVFVNPSFPSGQIICGTHDDSQLYDSYIYCPYILFAQYDISLFMRYGKKLISPKYYAKLNYEL